MAKQFKEWDKKFSHREVVQESNYWLPFNIMPSVIMNIDKWPLPVDVWPQDFVQHCVYHVEGDNYLHHRKWQLFRVSMKGHTTQEKVFMLINYYQSNVVEAMSEDERKIQKCRVDNYLGALIRGGQLNKEYEVCK